MRRESSIVDVIHGLMGMRSNLIIAHHLSPLGGSEVLRALGGSEVLPDVSGGAVRLHRLPVAHGALLG